MKRFLTLAAAVLAGLTTITLTSEQIAELSERTLLRAVYSERQLQEVLTEFWFNHFNVDARKGVAPFHVDTAESGNRGIG